LSDSSGIAAAPLADMTIGGGMDTVYRSSTYQDTWHESSAGNLEISAVSQSETIISYVSQGELTITGSSTNDMVLQPTSEGMLLVSGQTVANIALHVDSAGDLTVSPVGNAVTSAPSTIADGALAAAAIGGSYQSSPEIVVVSYISGGEYYPGNVAYTTSAGTEIITGNSTVTTASVTSEQTSGNLVISGSSETSHVVIQQSSGLLELFGNSEDPVVLNAVSAGNLSITGSSEQSSQRSVISAGLLQITGNTVAIYVPAGQNIMSAGDISVTGSSVVEFVPGPIPVARTGGGGSYVYPSSWDILTPYLPNDRLILGYQQGQSQAGRLRLKGYSAVTLVSNPAGRRKTLGDYMNSVQARRTESRPSAVVKATPAAKNRFQLQALAEDQLLLRDSLFEFDEIQDELDRELVD
jgi:hypothetical protein